jgi:protein-disulfide isomerase
MNKIGEIGSTFQDIVFLQTGAQHTVQYLNYSLEGDLVALDFVVDGSYPQTLYVTKDMNYLLQQPTSFADLKKQVSDAKAQAEADLEAANTPPVKSDEPQVLLFVMSFCPYGNVAENAFYDVVALMSEKMAFEPIYIISGSNGNYQSLHGPVELNQGIREKIVFNKYGEKKWMAFTFDVNANCSVQNADTCWKGAAERHGINTTMVEDEFAKNFNAIADAEVAKSAQYNVQGSPTIIMNGKEYQSGQRSAEAFKQFVCTGFNTAPGECSTALSTGEGTATGSCG